MRRALIALLSLLLALSLSGCKLKKAVEQASISAELATKGTTDLLKEAAKDEYTAPEDGRLTEAQIQMYLKVRDREKAIAKIAKQELQQHAAKANAAGEKSLAGVMEGFKSLGSIADFATADIRAAHELGFNTQEYTWVKGQILAASASVMTEKLQESMKAQMAAIQEQMKADPNAAKLFAQTTAEPGQPAEASAAPEDPALAYNRQLLSKYENTLNAFTSEMSKWEEKEGDAAKSMTEWQKATDKAIAEPDKPVAQP